MGRAMLVKKWALCNVMFLKDVTASRKTYGNMPSEDGTTGGAGGLTEHRERKWQLVRREIKGHGAYATTKGYR
jgi:hypothetical protein